MSKQILIVDDDDAVREIVQYCLEAAAGWEVLMAASGREGLAVARSQQPDAILLDVMMPDMDGLETLRQLQGDKTTQDIPTILLTAKARIGDRQQLQSLGVAGTISKPFEAVSLVEQVRSLLHWDE
ncbi:response regulator [Oscillatoriales cyanobacterium LEGE 11467]|uniref:Response regulator n=1 Tax=Zarconia navalis LEGE 11467 TaxID=1828826 RepID=A0A928VV27_9CYAN|nr:response regulator [Zarconia navalis]MBE9039828.1 response regulator [Zarconia navalis LEGE 11467]